MVSRKQLSIGVSAVIFLTVLGGCASGRFKQRKEARDRLAMQSRMYCDFVNQEQFPDVEVQLNLDMAKKCDPTKPHSISGYRTSKDETGLMFCCHLDATAKLGPDEVKPPAANPEPPRAPAQAAPAKQ